MSMMGSAPVGGGGLSFEDVIGLLKDEQAYQAKLRELQKRTEEARAALQQSVDSGRKAEEAKALTRKMLDQTTEQVVEARQLRDEADQKVATAAAHEKALADQHQTFQQHAEAELEGHREHLRNAFIAREKEVAAKEQALLAKIKDFEAQKDDLFAQSADFTAFKKSKEAEFARTETERKAELDLIAKAKADNEKMRQDLKAKLDAIKAISAK